MRWTALTDIETIKELRRASYKNPVIIYKHSTRCSTSRLVLDRLERNWDEHQMSGVHPFFLDLIAYRQVSNAVAEVFSVEHESPQILLISKGESVCDLSHLEIDYDRIAHFMKK